MSDTEEENSRGELPEWAQIQRKTFTRWCNQQLKPRDLQIQDLKVGLRDGVNLINLVEVLTQQPSPERFTKKPRIKMQMMENIGIGLRALTQDGIKLVNIGNIDIYEGNLKLILGLIWSLILHYQISLEFGEEDKESGKTGSAKVQLQEWAADLISNLPESRSVRNFTTDWNDGVALCSMVEAVAPGLCPEYVCLDPENPLENAQLGLDRAELGLGVQKIIEAEDLVNPNIDELSVLTYVSLLRSATPTIDLTPPDPSQIAITGPGSETATVNVPTQLFVDTTSAGFGRVEVEISDSNGDTVPVELQSEDSNVTTVQYTPCTPGIHTVHVTFNKEPVPTGDISVKVFLPTDPTKVKLSGEGLERAYVDKPTCFLVDTSEAGAGDVEVEVDGPEGELPVQVEQEEDKYSVKYTPTRPGSVLVSVKFAGEEVAGSPTFPMFVDVVDCVDPEKVQIVKDGVENSVEGKEIKFEVSTARAGDGELKVKVIDEDENPLPVEIRAPTPDAVREVVFTPEQHGEHHVTVSWSDQAVPDGEFTLEVRKSPDLVEEMTPDQVICDENPWRGSTEVAEVAMSAEELNGESLDKSDVAEELGACNGSENAICDDELIGNSPDMTAATDCNLVELDSKIPEGDTVQLNEEDHSPDIVVISESQPDTETELFNLVNCSPSTELEEKEDAKINEDVSVYHEETLPIAEDMAVDAEQKVAPLDEVMFEVEKETPVAEYVKGTLIREYSFDKESPDAEETLLEEKPVFVEEVVIELEEEIPIVAEMMVGVEEEILMVEEMVVGLEEESLDDEEEELPMVCEMVVGVDEQIPMEGEVEDYEEDLPVVYEMVIGIDEQIPTVEEVRPVAHKEEIPTVDEVEDDLPVVEEVIIGIGEKIPVAEEVMVVREEEIPIVDEEVIGIEEAMVSRQMLIKEETPAAKQDIEEIPIVDDVVIEEVKAGVKDSQPEVELEFDLELEASDVTVEDVTKQEVRSVLLIETAPELGEESQELPDNSQELVEESPELVEESQELAEESPELVEESPELPEKSRDITSDSTIVAVGDRDSVEVRDAQVEDGNAAVVINGAVEVELKPIEETKTPPKDKPLGHVICSIFLLLSLISCVGDELLPNLTETALSFLLLSYLLTYAAVDQELLDTWCDVTSRDTPYKVNEWYSRIRNILNTAFTLAVFPLLFTYLGNSAVACQGMCNLGYCLGALLGVELVLLSDQLRMKMLVPSVVVGVGGVVVSFLY